MKQKLKIEGMMCGHCVSRVKKALAALDPEVEVSLADSCAWLSEGVDLEAAGAAVTAAGYTVVN